MLVGRYRTVPRRVIVILLWLLAALSPVVLWSALAGLGLVGWPKANSGFGVLTGVVGGLIVYFEMLVWPRKWFRGWRLGATKIWLRWHVYLGLACLPIIVLHSGVALGGPLAKWTMILFLLVIASGVWGLILQNVLPSKLLAEIPGETVASQVDLAVDKHVKEAENILKELTQAPPEEEELLAVTSVAAPAKTKLRTAVTGAPGRQLERFHLEMLQPYLKAGARSGSPLRSRHKAEVLFSRIRGSLPPDAVPSLDRLEEIADIRRQWDRQVRINFWLHNWLLVHLPLSVAMTLFMTVHAVMALKYW